MLWQKTYLHPSQWLWTAAFSFPIQPCSHIQLSTGMFNFFTGTKERLFSSVKSTTQCVGWTVWKKILVVATHMERGLVHQVFTLEGKSGSVYIPVTQQASVMAKVHSIARLPSIYNLLYIPLGAGYGQAWTLWSDWAQWSRSNSIEGVLSPGSTPRENLFLPARTTCGILLVWNLYTFCW